MLALKPVFIIPPPINCPDPLLLTPEFANPFELLYAIPPLPLFIDYAAFP
jgi:hypothetical protein